MLKILPCSSGKINMFFFIRPLYVKCLICELLVLNSDLDLKWLLLRYGRPAVQQMNHQIIERCAMLQNQAVDGKTVGLVLGFPILLRRISFPKRKNRHVSQTRPGKGSTGRKKPHCILIWHMRGTLTFVIFLGHVHVKSRFLAVSCLM